MPTEVETIVCPSCGALNRAPGEKLAAGALPKCGSCHAPLFKSQPVDVASAADFDRFVSKGSLPVLVDFWAAWCGPCRMMGPQFAAAAASLEPNMRLLKVDTEALQEIAARYGIRSIPTMILFKDGRELARQSGAMNAADIVRWVNRAA